MEREHIIRPPELREARGVLGSYADLFVQRWDNFARQRDHSRSYYRVLDEGGRPRPLTSDVLKAHLRGEMTIGLYSVDPDGFTKWSVMDCDSGFAPLQPLRQQLRNAGIASYTERSRTGFHEWIFWQKRIRPDIARKILSPYTEGMEVFPAGDIPDEDGLGLCIRAPLGIHRLSMHRYGFINEDLGPIVPGSLVRGQVDWLMEHVRKTDPDPLIAQTDERETYPPLIRGGTIYVTREMLPIRRYLAEHPCREVVGQYVELNARGLGHCPWGERHKHADMHKSFQVFDLTNKWWCYRERRGGNAFDFLVRYWDCTPTAALKRARELGQH